MERARAWFAEQEAARIVYERKTPEERELIKQAPLWDAYEFVFLARIEKIKIGEKIWPQPPPKPKRSKREPLPPEPPVPVIQPFDESHEAFIRPVKWLKGSESFKPSWRIVGGSNTCGGSVDGSLGYTYPVQEVVIFANWATRIRTLRGKDVSSQYLHFYGLKREEIVDPKILTALKNAATNSQ
jgi:hypothetical protein